MKFLVLPLALATLALTPLSLHADSFDPPVLKTGVTVDALTQASVTYLGVAATQYTYVNEKIGVLGALGAVLSSSTSTFTATYAALSPTLAVLDVTDVCADVYLLGHAPACQSFAFSFNNVVLGNGSVGDASISSLLLASATAGISFADLNIDGLDVEGTDIAGASIGGGGGRFIFKPVPGPAATPEPSSLFLLATGLASTAGVLRRRMTASVNA